MSELLLAPTEDYVETALRSFLLAIMADGVEVFKAQGNRVPAARPTASNYIEFTPVRRTRLSTNRDDWADCSFAASIAGTVMNVSSVSIGTISVGAQVFGTGVSNGTGALLTRIISQLSGVPGESGMYEIIPSQTADAQPMAAGGREMLVATDFVYQLDVFGPLGGDNAQIIHTLMRDEAGVALFRDVSEGVTPLYAEDPRQLPFYTGETQWQDRWVVELHLQVDPVVRVPQQFADALEVELINVDATFPP